MRPTVSPLNIPAAEWQVLITSRPNLLLVGERTVTEATVHGLEPHFVSPIWRHHPRTALSLPHYVGTLLLFEVAQLAIDEQRQLFQWLDEASTRVQVVSTTARPLFALVERGEFPWDLYYRLNIVCLGASPTD